MTTIEWTRGEDGSLGKTWNPTLGCDVVSPGCAKCYAMTLAARLARMGQSDYQGLTRDVGGGKAVWTGVLRTLPKRLTIPLERKKPTTWFVDSMSDLFHEGVPFEFIAACYGIAAACPHHTFQLLTKRPERRLAFWDWWRAQNGGWLAPVLHVSLGAYYNDIHPGPQSIDDPETPLDRACEDICDTQDEDFPLANIWEGTSVEDRKHGVPRIDLLRRTPAAVRFLSIEPLLEDLGELDLSGIDWVIAGAESGRGARPMQDDWVRSIRDQCVAQGVRFFFKQRATPAGRKLSLPVLDGRQWSEMPEARP